MHRRFGPVPTGRGPALLRLVGLGLVKVEGHRRERATLASASAVSSRLPLLMKQSGGQKPIKYLQWAQNIENNKADYSTLNVISLP
jgi:hypothetical protein